jgi:autotransporter-associated beta strand protein
MRIPLGKLRFAKAIAALALGTFLTAQASAQDTDADGLPNSVETNTGIYVSQTNTGTNPAVADTDGDGAGDWYEVFASFTNPTNPTSKPNVPYPLPKPDTSTGITTKPVKVFILAGQSNMVGMGDMNPLGANGTLSTIVKTEKKFPNLLDTSGNWSARQDVQYRGVISAIAKAGLTVGQGSSTSTIGPELGMGHVMGYHLDEPVLVIKAAQGNRSLGWDFLPPGSPRSTSGSTTYAGYGDSQKSWTGTAPGAPGAGQSYAGWQYDQSFLAFSDWYGPGSTTDVVNVADVLDNWATEYPQWAAQGFEIAGFAWFQGWNDGLSYETHYANRYEANLVQLIKQLRIYYEGRYPGKIAPQAPFVVATCGFSGFAATGNRLTVVNAQLAVGNPTKYPEFAGNVKSMDTRGYWRTREQSNSKQDYHYWRNAETFMLVGDALGRGMIDLLGPGIPPPPQPNVWSQTAGGPQSWTTALNWDDGAIPNPTSTTTMDFSRANILADTTLNLGANRTSQNWKFGDASGTQNWIVSAGNTMTLAGTTPTIDVTNNTTRLENVVAGTAGLTKTGGGILTLTAINSYTGTTTISAGTLQLGNGGSTGSLVPSGTLTNNAALVFNRSSDLIQGTDFAAAIMGTGTLTKQGAGILTLSGSNTYSGATSIGGGVLRLANTTAVQNSSEVRFAASNTFLQLRTDSAFSSLPILIGGYSSTTNPTVVSDRATAGAGLTHALGTGNFGNTTINFTAGSNVTSGTAGVSLTSISMGGGSGGTLTLNPTSANLTILGSATGGSTGTTNVGNLTLSGTSQGNSIGGIIGNGTRTTQNISKSGNSTWTLSGANTYNGTTTVSGGVLITTKAAALPGFNTPARVVFSGGTIGARVGGSGWTTAEVDTLLTSATKTSGALGIDTTNGNLTQWTPFTTNLGPLGLTKLGANTLTLNQANTYGGATTISGGTLALGASNALPATAVSIGNATLNAATFSHTLGTLTVTGSAVINLGAGSSLAFAPGNAIPWPGTLTLTGSFVSGSSLRFGTTGAALDSTQLGKISATGFTNFGLTPSGFLTATTVPTYTIANTTSDVNGTCTPTGDTVVNVGGSQTYTLTPNADCVVATLTVNGVPVTPALSYTFNNVSSNQTINATFVNIATDALHWDSNSATPGFGNTTGTWGTNQFWTIDADGASAPLPITTLPTSSVNFGSATLNYNNAAVSIAAGGVSAGNLTFGAGQSTALTLSGGPITLGATAVITVNNAPSTIASVLTGAGTSLTKAGTGSLTLSAANTYSGATAIASGTLRMGANNVLPDANLEVTGTLDLNTFSETINGLTGIGTVDTAAGGSPTLTVGGANATSTFSGTITDTNGTLALEKTGSGTVVLTGTNGYSGPTTITGGTLQIGDGGTTGSIASNAGVINDAILIFNRSNDLTVACDISGGGALTKQGAGVLTLSGNNNYTGQTTISTGTLRLASPTAMQNSSLVAINANRLEIMTSAGITSNSSVSMNGGTIALNQPAPAPGLTHAFEQFAFAHNTQNFTSSNVNDGNATLTFANGTVRSGSGGTATLNPTGVNLVIGSFEGGNTGTSTLRLGGTTTLNRIDDAIENGARTTQNIIKSNTGTWTLSGDNVYTGNTTIEQGTLKVGASGAIPSGAGTGNVVFNTAANTAILDLNGNDATINGLIQASASTTNRVVNNSPATLATLTAGENDTTSTFAGIIADNTGTGGTLALTKTGTGTLTLSGPNTYTGDTTVSAGTLVLTDNAQLRFVTGTTSGTNNRLAGTGTVTLNGDFNIDTILTDASALSSGSWTLVDTATLTETFASTFTLTGPGWSEAANVWTKTVGSKNYTFTEATGILALSSTAPDTSYATWAATNASTTTPAQDEDNDGVSNAVEYVLGGDALTNDLSKLPTISAPGANVEFSFKRIQTSINAATTLSIQVGTTLLAWPDTYIIGDTTATPPTGVTILKGEPVGFDTITLSIPRAPDLQKFVRLHVTVTP